MIQRHQKYNGVPYWGMTLPEYYAYQEKIREAHFAQREEDPNDPYPLFVSSDKKNITTQNQDTVTLNGNTYIVNNDPTHQRRQRAGYCGRNPK